MQQLDLLDNGFNIARDQLSLRLIPDYLSLPESQKLLEALIQSTPWLQPSIQVFGKWHPTPRLLQFYGDAGLEYKYSSTQHATQAWTSTLRGLKSRIENTTSQHYNSVLLNYYRDGNDSLGWHSDDEAELGDRPCIASLSLGAARDIHFKTRGKRKNLIKLNLQPGSLLIMDGPTQQAWQHCIPRRAKCSEPRLNLTFRMIYSTDHARFSTAIKPKNDPRK